MAGTSVTSAGSSSGALLEYRIRAAGDGEHRAAEETNWGEHEGHGTITEQGDLGQSWQKCGCEWDGSF